MLAPTRAVVLKPIDGNIVTADIDCNDPPPNPNSCLIPARARKPGRQPKTYQTGGTCAQQAPPAGSYWNFFVTVSAHSRGRAGVPTRPVAGAPVRSVALPSCCQ